MAQDPPVRYLLDTNICIYITKGQPAAVRERFARHALHELAMSTITVGELRFGAEKSQARERAWPPSGNWCSASSPARCRLPLPSTMATSAPRCKGRVCQLATMTCGWPRMHAPRAGFW